MQHSPYWTWSSIYGDLNVYYVEQGSGSSHVLLLHGFGAHTYTWHALIAPLAEAGFHVWALDLVGFGLSDKPLNIPYGLDVFLTQIETFMQDKKIEELHLIGNSMGGGLALAMAIFHPERILSLTLIDPLCYPIKLPSLLWMGQAFGKWAKPFLGKMMIRQALKQLIYDPGKITAEQIQAYALPFSLPGAKEAFLQTLKRFNNQQLEQLSLSYPNLKTPTLIIWGEEDRWIPLIHGKRLAQQLPNAQLQTISKCGHIPQEELPALTLPLILNFLQH